MTAGWFARLRADLRQRGHHRAFRIPPPRWPADPLAGLLAELAVAARPSSVDAATPPGEPAGPGKSAPGKSEPGKSEPGKSAPGKAAPDDGALDDRALATAATNLWRARQKLAQRADDPPAQARQAGRYLRQCEEALNDAGLVVQDHDGETFHSGRSLEVLVMQQDPTLTTERVLETVRPSIFRGDRRIQMGQVIVGRPPKPGGDTTSETSDRKDGTCATPSTSA